MISVVIPAYNAADTIQDCLRALNQQTLPPTGYEVIVVDDGSQDNTAELAAACGAHVLHQDRGRPATARNGGAKAARGEIVCFTDADCIPAPDWVAQMARPFSDPEVIGCKGIYCTQQQELVARFVQIEYEDKYDLLRPQPTINFIDTYSAAYRRDVLLANDGFDERFPYLEDQELSFRLAARGYKMVFQPDAVVAHRHSDSLWRYFRKKWIIGYWKAQVVRRFPTRGVSDSHTPQVMKVQMALMAGMVATAVFPLLATLFAPRLASWSALPILALLLLFLLTTIPFMRKAWAKDRAVAMIAPLLLGIRALALGLGYGWGLLWPQPEVTGAANTIGGMAYLSKRGLDVAGSLLGLTFTALVGPVIALAIRLDSPGPVIFRQERVGQDGRPFTLYKFRSMHVGAEKQLDDILDLDELQQPAFKLHDDPRLTRIGRFLRRWSLDELPQFWNVFKGEMSLVGPRPEESRLVTRYTDWHRRRLAVKPGMTGPMQVNGRGDLSLDERVQLELDYIENYTLRRDLVILAQTVPAVIKGAGAR